MIESQNINSNTEKKCRTCGLIKDYSEFRSTAMYLDGRGIYCRTCLKIKDKEHYRTKKGLISHIYRIQKLVSRNRGHIRPQYTKRELIEWCYNQPNIDTLFNNWEESGYKKDLIPSIDRLDDYKGYSFDNIRLVTWAENYKKSHSDRKTGKNNKNNRAVLQYDLNGNFIKEYYSAAQAFRDTGIGQSSISVVCRGKSKAAGGFTWKYKEEV